MVDNVIKTKSYSFNSQEEKILAEKNLARRVTYAQLKALDEVVKNFVLYDVFPRLGIKEYRNFEVDLEKMVVIVEEGEPIKIGGSTK